MCKIVLTLYKVHIVLVHTHKGLELIPGPYIWRNNFFCKSYLRTDVRGDFNIHGTKNFQDAVFHHKSKIYDFLSILKLLLRFLSPFLIKKKIFEKNF